MKLDSGVPDDISKIPGAKSFKNEEELNKYLEDQKKLKKEEESFGDTVLIDFIRHIRSKESMCIEWDCMPPRKKKIVANAMKRNFKGIERWMLK